MVIAQLAERPLCKRKARVSITLDYKFLFLLFFIISSINGGSNSLKKCCLLTKTLDFCEMPRQQKSKYFFIFFSKTLVFWEKHWTFVKCHVSKSQNIFSFFFQKPLSFEKNIGLLWTATSAESKKFWKKKMTPPRIELGCRQCECRILPLNYGANKWVRIFVNYLNKV